MITQETPTFISLVHEIRRQQIQIKALTNSAVQSKQLAAFQQEPWFKQMQTMFDMVDQGVEIFGNKFKTFGNGYASPQQEGGEQ